MTLHRDDPSSTTDVEEAVRAVLESERYVLDVGAASRAVLAALARGEPGPPGASPGDRLLHLARRAVLARLYPDPAGAEPGEDLAGFDAATVRAAHAAFNRRARADRDLLWASEIEGRSPSEIARERGRSESETREALRGARRRFVDDFRRTMRRSAPRREEGEDVA